MAGSGGMSSNSGGHAMAPGGVPGGVVAPGQASVGPAAGSASTGASSLLWAKTQQLPEEAFRQLHSIYGDHFPIEARHHLAGKSSYFLGNVFSFYRSKMNLDWSKILIRFTLF